MCNKHKNTEYCWKPQEDPFKGNYCIPLDGVLLNIWTEQIVNGQATKTNAPQAPEFWQIKESAKAKSFPRYRGKSVPHAARIPVAPNVYVHVSDRETRYPPQTPRRSENPPECSPVRGFDPWQYNNEGLSAYLEYLRVRFQDDDFIEAFDILSEQKIGIDIFKRCTTKDMKKDLEDQLCGTFGIKVGTTKHIIWEFALWQKQLIPHDI